MNTLSEIKELINAYFAGETSLQQEEDLRNYFAAGNVADDLKQYQAIFAYFVHKQNNVADDEADNIVTPPANKAKHRQTIWYVVTGIAAGLALLITTMLYNTHIYNTQDIVCEGTFVIIDGKCTDDPKKVSAVAIEAIDALLVPTNDIVYELNTLIDENANVVDEHIEVLKHVENKIVK